MCKEKAPDFDELARKFPEDIEQVEKDNADALEEADEFSRKNRAAIEEVKRRFHDRPR